MIKVLVGGPYRPGEGALYRAHVRCINASEGVDITFMPTYDDECRGLQFNGANHQWTDQKCDRVGYMRQRFFETFIENGCYDYGCMIDSDVLVAPNVIRRLVDECQRGADVAYGVFWTKWGQHAMPNCWLWHPYDQPDMPGVKLLWKQLKAGGAIRVNGGGACTVFTPKAMQVARYHPRLKGLPRDGSMWVGEDRTFALCCEVHQLKQVAVGGLVIHHLYREDQRTEEYINKVMGNDRTRED